METEVKFIKNGNNNPSIVEKGIEYYPRNLSLAFNLFNLRTTDTLTIDKKQNNNITKSLTFDAKFINPGNSISFFGYSDWINKYEIFIRCDNQAVKDNCVIVAFKKSDLNDIDTLVFQCNVTSNKYNELLNKIKNSNEVRFFCTPESGFYAEHSFDLALEAFTRYKIISFHDINKILNPKKLKNLEKFLVEPSEASEFTFHFIQKNDDEELNNKNNVKTYDEEIFNLDNENKELKYKIKEIDNDLQRLNTQIKVLQNDDQNKNDVRQNNQLLLFHWERIFIYILVGICLYGLFFGVDK